ncbi:MAG: hypothetical protein RBT68_08045 [Spirochaetia bacterium]|jgi:uroporphyrinogen decarboxylase|nr:hypothetical protein [Spirochaetia bacterium]
MNSRERVLKAFHVVPGKPDRPPLQFDLCKSLTDHFSGALGIPADYALSYYEDLTYRISANAIRTAMGSDCVIVGGTVREGFVPKPVSGDIRAPLKTIVSKCSGSFNHMFSSYLLI